VYTGKTIHEKQYTRNNTRETMHENRETIHEKHIRGINTFTGNINAEKITHLIGINTARSDFP
jgi:hypothetical protein